MDGTGARKLFLSLCACVGACLFTPSQSAGQEEVVQMTAEQTLRQTQLDFGDKWLARDAEGIISHYASDAVLLVPGQPLVEGRDAFAPYIREIAPNPDFALAWSVDRVEVSAAADIGWVFGRYVQHNPREAQVGFTVETGHYVTTYRNEGGRWLAIVEINTPGPLKSESGLPPAMFAEDNASSTSADHVQTEVETANVEVVRRHIVELWQQGRTEIVAEIIDPDFTDHNPFASEGTTTEDYVAGITMMQKGFSEQNYRIIHLFGVGNLVVDHWEFRGRHTGDFMDIAPTGREVTFSGTDIFRLQHGKIVEIWHTEQIDRLVAQLTD